MGSRPRGAEPSYTFTCWQRWGYNTDSKERERLAGLGNRSNGANRSPVGKKGSKKVDIMQAENRELVEQVLAAQSKQTETEEIITPAWVMEDLPTGEEARGQQTSSRPGEGLSGMSCGVCPKEYWQQRKRNSQREVLEKEFNSQEDRSRQMCADYLELATQQRRLTKVEEEREETQAKNLLARNGIDPRMFPVYKEGEEVGVFVHLFEAICEEEGIAEAQKMTLLRSQVSGSLMELIATLPQDKRLDYEFFKTLVKNQFALSAEHCRKKFRQLTKKPEETAITPPPHISSVELE